MNTYRQCVLRCILKARGCRTKQIAGLRVFRNSDIRLVGFGNSNITSRVGQQQMVNSHFRNGTPDRHRMASLKTARVPLEDTQADINAPL